MVDLLGRSFVKESDFTPQEWWSLLDLAVHLKVAKAQGTEDRRLKGKNIALVFEKTSTRTRCAFEVAAYDQGAHVTYLDPSGSQIGHKESIKDTARVLGRFFDGIEYRGHDQQIVETLARLAGVPVWNGLTNQWHPTQMLADQLTMIEHTDKPLGEVSYAFLGDSRYNMGNSTLVSSALVGMDVRICAPEGFQPSPEVVAAARAIAEQTGARITITDDVHEAVSGCDYVATDVWVSMGEPKEVWQQRIAALMPYQVNAAAMAATGNADVKFLHCLPAFHNRETSVGEEIFQTTGHDGLEVTEEVFESEASVVFDQAENRMHTIKAVMVASLSSAKEGQPPLDPPPLRRSAADAAASADRKGQPPLDTAKEGQPPLDPPPLRRSAADAAASADRKGQPPLDPPPLRRSAADAAASADEES